MKSPTPEPIAPLGDDLVHEDHQQSAKADLEKDQDRDDERVTAKELRRHRRIGQHHPANDHRERLDHDHHEDEHLLQAHIHDLAAGFAGIDLQEAGTLEQLQHN